jgi:hypothetical protein
MNAPVKAKAPRNSTLYAAIKPRSSTARFTFVSLPQARKSLSPRLKEARKPRQFNVFLKACAKISCGLRQYLVGVWPE